MSLNRAKPALLNEETEWKTPSQMARPRGSPYAVANRRVSSTATIDSTIREMRTTPRTSPRTSSSPKLLTSAAAVMRDRRDILRMTARPITEANVMMPKPPTWIRARMMTWPNGVQYVAVSTTVSPVTQTADVAVKAAIRNGVPPGPGVEIGIMSSTVPTRMAPANPATTTCAGCSRARGTRGPLLRRDKDGTRSLYGSRTADSRFVPIRLSARAGPLLRPEVIRGRNITSG